MANVDIKSILKKPVSGFKSDIKAYSLTDLNELLYALKLAVDSPDNDEAMEDRITSFIDLSEKQIKKLSDIKKKNGVSASEASANLANILGFGVKAQTTTAVAMKHKLDDKKSIKDIAKKVADATPKAAKVDSTPVAQKPDVAPKPQPKVKKPKGFKSGKNGQYLLFGIEPEQNKEVDEVITQKDSGDNGQMSFNFNQKVRKEPKTKTPSQTLILRERAIALKAAQLDETKRRHAANEQLERQHLDVRNKESLRINQREKESNRVRLEVANLDLEKSKIRADNSRDMQESKLKTLKSIQTSKARAVLKKEQLKAESMDKRNEANKEVKLAQLKYKKERDDQKRMDSAARREEREQARQNRLKQGKHDKTYGFLKDLSPTTAYAYKLATGGFGSSTKVSKETKSEGSSTMMNLMGALFAKDAIKGIFGRGKSVLGKMSGSIMGAGKFAGGKAMDGIGKATSAPLGKGIGGIAGKAMSKLPLIGGLITGLSEYAGGSSVGKSVAVGTGATLGASIGAMAGAMFGPPGIIIGGILGGILGDIGAKKIFDMFVGNSTSPTQPLPTQSISASQNTNQLSVGKIGKSGVKGANEATPEEADKLSKLEKKYGLPSGLLDSVWAAESGRGKNMLSKKGAMGHFQFMPKTAKEFGLKNPYDFNESSEAAAKYYSQLLKRYNGDVTKAVAAYNWGMGNVSSKGLQAAPKETTEYVGKVMGNMSTSSNRLSHATEKKETMDKVAMASPQQVYVAGGSSTVGGNTTNTNVYHAPETDPFIRQVAMSNMKSMAFA